MVGGDLKFASVLSLQYKQSSTCLAQTKGLDCFDKLLLSKQTHKSKGCAKQSSAGEEKAD